uniref:Homeobox domain-containing protein n=1 Tax=Davidia involucrata TaxID=16924 RepID=A0A5B7APH5_DAVIN
MEESCEVYSEENKALPEKNKKRRLKTASQVEALEKFYNENKYPPESMKLQIAESLELTEKQISGWFCHRRLKDKKLLDGEAKANGRQDRSSGVIQDRGSGLGQDSCGSTKQGDYRHFDPREVESRRFSGHEFSAADLAYEHGSHYTRNYSGTDDTSSESSSSFQNRFFTQNEDPFEMTTSRYLTQYGNNAPIDVKVVKTRNGPSGFLKVKGRVENAAITAVKRQLGRNYREDGPPLGVEFQPLPPGAFESSIRDSVNEPYYIGEPILPNSPDVPRTRKQPNPDTRYEVYNSKVRTYNPDLDGTSFKIMDGSDRQEKNSHHQYKQKSPLPNNSNPFPGWNSAIMNEDSAEETSGYDSTRKHGMRSKHGVQGMRMDSVSSHHLHPYVGKVTSEQTEPWLHNHNDVSHKLAQRECFEPKTSNSTLKCGEALDVEDRGLSRRMDKEDKFYGERREINEYCDPVRVKIHPTNARRVAKRVKDEFLQRQYSTKASIVEIPPRTNQIKRSAAEMPSSFSEDETEETSSSVD